MSAQLSGILAQPLPWWFWGFAGAAGAWGVAEYSGAPKRKQEIATLTGLVLGAFSGFILQPGGSVSGLGASAAEWGAAMRGKPRMLRLPQIRPGMGRRQRSRVR